MPTPNILHLIAALAAGATIYLLQREARGRSLSPGQLFAGLPFALVTALLLLAMQSPADRQPVLWLAGLAGGTAAGVIRGLFLTLQLDRMYSRLRLPNGRDGLWAACGMAAFLVAAFAAALAGPAIPFVEPGATGAVAACAGYLVGRAGTLWRRSLTAPHSTLH
ncbi:hypothetical protein [Reyranella aquatilis]|uniref:DUF1453 domain-containing protein n=1 Tax=Reyranella aquatilis TaxID=2035356 RepID=A0ABS8KQY7_9HYPH|nr:hypothetical protein [Reyranella aquatilis]MCC8428483.1 hypothetical protein [Reyranella aquatilis]